MSTKTIERQINNLNRQMVMLRSVVISVIGEKDPEGEYNPEFVNKILKLANKKQKAVKFTNSTDFFKMIS